MALDTLVGHEESNYEGDKHFEEQIGFWPLDGLVATAQHARSWNELLEWTVLVMGAKIWQVTLEISTFLGGLAALVFFYDRFGHLLARPRINLGLSSSTKRKTSLSLWATAVILIGCGIIGSIGFWKGPFPQLITSSMTGFFSLAVLAAVKEMRGFTIRRVNGVNLLLHFGFSVSFAGSVSSLSMVYSGFLSDNIMDNLNGSLARNSPQTAYAGVAICIALGICYCFLAFRPAQREKSWN